jgi:hypothetical protein
VPTASSTSTVGQTKAKSLASLALLDTRVSKAGTALRFVNPTPLCEFILTDFLQCGTCYGVTYNGKTVYVLAVDHTATGFNMAKAAMDELTNNQAASLGRIDAQYAQVAVSKCGL